MAEVKFREEPSGPGARKPQSRKPYVKPGFVRERLFETMALACGKIATQGACSHARKTS